MMLNPNKLSVLEFANKFIEDYEKFESMGYSNKQIFRFLGTLQYVQDFADTPQWLETADKLPKGYKWSDGEKFRFNIGNKHNGNKFTNVVLDVKNDLWIKGGIRLGFWGDNRDGILDSNGNVSKTFWNIHPQIAIIKNWRDLDIATINKCEFELGPYLTECIVLYGRSHGMRYNKNSILKDL